MAVPVQKYGDIHSPITSRIPRKRSVDEEMHEDLALACECLSTREQAIYAVTRTWDRLETTIAAQSENRRSHYQAAEKRQPYKPFTENGLVRRRLLLDSIRHAQIAGEASITLHDDERDMQYLSLELVLTIMHHNPFYAAVAMTRVIASYPAATTLAVYDHLVLENNASKDASAVSRVQDVFAEPLKSRFDARIKLKPGSKTRFQRVTPSHRQAEALRYWLLRFFSATLDTKVVFQPTSTSGIGIHEGTDHMKPVKNLLDMESFNLIANKLGIPKLETNCRSH